MESSKQHAPADTPSILSKAFDILRAFDSVHRIMTLSELARASGLPKSTVHRLLGRLVELDVIEPHGNAGYKIGLGMLRIGTVSPALSMRDSAMPYLGSLQRWTGRTVHLWVLRQFEVVCLEKLDQAGVLPAPGTVGARAPAHCTAAGKALLAHEDLDDLALFLPSPLPAATVRSRTSVDALVRELREVRGSGVAHEADEYRLGHSGIGAAIVVRGFAVGAISIGYPSDDQPAFKTVSALREVVAALSRDLSEGLTPDRYRWIPGAD